MWTASIARTERQIGTLAVVVTYTDGTNEFSDTISTESAQNPEWIKTQISNKLGQLNSLDSYEQTIATSDLVNATLSVDDGGNLTSIPIKVDQVVETLPPIEKPVV